MIDKIEAAQRLINVVCGEPYGDGMTVTDIGVGYAEPGYQDNETVWVLGDWNDKDRYDPETQKRVKTSNAPSRLFDALERIGVQGEWYDEWDKCDHCYRIYRTSPDSYMWKRFYVDLEDGDSLCGECAMDPDFIDDWLPSFVNDPNKVVTFCNEGQLESLGWERYNAHQYESGWHSGQTARPHDVLAEIQHNFPTKDVVFWLDEASQFYIGFSAYMKERQEDEEGDE